jgi:hypothetical protein
LGWRWEDALVDNRQELEQESVYDPGDPLGGRVLVMEHAPNKETEKEESNEEGSNEGQPGHYDLSDCPR